MALAAAGARFGKLPGRLLGGKVALARAAAGFSGLTENHVNGYIRVTLPLTSGDVRVTLPLTLG